MARSPLFLLHVLFTCHIISTFSEWYGILNRVYRANNEELKDMKDESANIKNAVVSLLLELFVISVFFSFFLIFLFFLQFKGTIDTIIIESISIEMIDERYDVFLLQNIENLLFKI